MKRHITPLLLSLCLLGFISVPTLGAAATQSASSVTSKKATAVPSNPSTNGDQDQIEGPTDLPTSGTLYLPMDLDVPGQSFVSSGPYIGIPLEYSGSNLIINSPNVNEDIALLNIRKSIAQRLVALGRPNDSSGSHILLSGVLEGQGLYQSGPGEHHSDIDLTTANLDAYILGPSSWTSGLLELSYDNNIGTQTGAFSSNDRVLNSRVYVNKGFIVLGDFLKSPFYASLGQMYVPFGVYSSTMISSPFTKILGRTHTRALVVGYKEQAPSSLNVSGYVFQGRSYVSAPNRINNGGINLDYAFKMHKVNADVGGGFIGNIADSQGMQYTGNSNQNPPEFGGFGGPDETYTCESTNPNACIEATGSEQLEHRVPAYDFHALIGLGDNVQLLGEYIFAATTFSSADLTIDGKAARPQAMHVEGVYNIPYFVKPTSIGIAYDMSKDGLAIGLPAQRYSLTITRSFWKNTLQALEFRRDVNYAADKTSSGSGIEGPSGNGESANMVTLQFDYFF